MTAVDDFNIVSAIESTEQVVADIPEIASAVIDWRDKKVVIDVVFLNGRTIDFNVTDAIACSDYTTWQTKFRMIIGLHRSG